MARNGLFDEAKDILISNDRGGYTLPSPRQYPHQWNWDSAFVALGYTVFDHDRAWTEIHNLLEGQWSNGMIPHIIFRKSDIDYFPGPEHWSAGEKLPSSGYTQPPILTSVVCKMADNNADDLERASMVFSQLYAWNRWFHTFRDPDQTGVFAILHPWESGRDNCPDWDLALDNVIVTETIDQSLRHDTKLVDQDQRPTGDHYDRYLELVRFGREHKWDPVIMYRLSPFLVADPGIQFILMRADRDLYRLAKKLGRDKEADTLAAWLNLSIAGNLKLWNDQTGGYCAKDLRSNRFSPSLSNASLLAFYADCGHAQNQSRLLSKAHKMVESVPFSVPSWDPSDKAYEPSRYWRGPVWAQMNYIIALGLRACDHHELADRIQRDTMNLIEQHGFYEYFDPVTGRGLGGDRFSWTAAVSLLWNKTRAKE